MRDRQSWVKMINLTLVNPTSTVNNSVWHRRGLDLPLALLSISMETPLISNELPPLLGDGQGHYRIHIVGNSGASRIEQESLSNQLP